MITKKGEISFDALHNVLKTKVHRVVGSMAVNHFKSGFRTGGGKTDASAGGWPKRKGDKDAGRATLVKSGNLRRSVRVSSSNRRRVVISANMPYASYHNDGNRRLPKREFIGDSRVLQRNIESEIFTIIDTTAKRHTVKNTTKKL